MLRPLSRIAKRFFEFVMICEALFVVQFPLTVFAGNDQTVALVMKALTNPFFSKMESGAKEAAAKENIKLEVFGIERETDVERQIGIVENLISRGYGAIIIAPADSKLLIPACMKAIRKDIAVINVDNPFHQQTLKSNGLSIPFIGPDNRDGAALVGSYLKHKLNGKGHVIVIEGIRDVENAELRKKGFIEAVTQGSRIKVAASESANWHKDEALALAVSLIRPDRSVDAVFCANDSMALGVLQALDILGLSGRTLLAGYDNTEAVRHEMSNGRIQATVEQHPELMGRFGVELAATALKGKELPQDVPVPIDLITYETFNKTIGFSISNLNNPFFVSLKEKAMETAGLHGIKLLVRDAENSNAQQLADLKDFLDMEVDALVINPTNTETVTPGIEVANRRGIPIITVDRKAAGGRVVCHIESNNLEGGKMAAFLLMRHLGGNGTIIELEGIPGTSAAQERGAGFNEAIQKLAGIEIVSREVAGFDREKAELVIRTMLRKGISFDGIFAHNDSMILGALDALEAFGIQSQKVLVGFDGIEDVRDAIGQGRISGTIAQQPEKMGMLAIQSAARLFRKQRVAQTILVDLEVLEKP